MRRRSWLGADWGRQRELAASPCEPSLQPPNSICLPPLGVSYCVSAARPSLRRLLLSFSQPANTTHELPFTPVRDCPGSSVVKTRASTIGSSDLIPGRETDLACSIYLLKERRYHQLVRGNCGGGETELSSEIKKI